MLYEHNGLRLLQPGRLRQDCFYFTTNKKGYFEAYKCHLITLFVVCFFTIPFWGDGFINTVLFNKEQMAVFAVGLDYGSTQLLIPIIVLLIVYLNVIELNYFNRNLLISMLTLLFTIFLVFVSPMPAWFVWIVPFLVIYYGCVAENRYAGMIVYAFFNCFYVLYFIFFHQTEYIDIKLLGNSIQFMKIDELKYKYVFFTAMVACLSIIVYRVFKFGIASNSLYQRKNIPFSIGIAGAAVQEKVE